MFRLTPARSRIRRAAGVAASTADGRDRGRRLRLVEQLEQRQRKRAAAQQQRERHRRPAGRRRRRCSGPTSITVTTPVGKAFPAARRSCTSAAASSVCQLQGQIVAAGGEGARVDDRRRSRPTERRPAFRPRTTRRCARAPTRSSRPPRFARRSPRSSRSCSQRAWSCRTAARPIPSPRRSSTTPSTPSQGGADRQGPGRRGRRRQQGQGQHAVREHPGVHDPRLARDVVQDSLQAVLPDVRVRLDRRAADAARERAEPDRLLPAQPPVGQLRRAVGRERARHRASGGAVGSRPVERQDRRSGRRSDRLPVRGQRPGAGAGAVRLLQRRLPDGRRAGAPLRRRAGPADAAAAVAGDEDEPAQQPHQPVPGRRRPTRASS